MHITASLMSAYACGCVWVGGSSISRGSSPGVGALKPNVMLTLQFIRGWLGVHGACLSDHGSVCVAGYGILAVTSCRPTHSHPTLSRADLMAPRASLTSLGLGLSSAWGRLTVGSPVNDHPLFAERTVLGHHTVVAWQWAFSSGFDIGLSLSVCRWLVVSS
jgi:hypothetical protein